MISRTLITALFALIIYLIFVPLLLPNVQIEQHQEQGNKIKAQNFIYNNSDTIDNVIVGSSLASRILSDSLDNFYNLSFAGQSIFEGLNILLRKKHLPKNVFIETNVILRSEDEAFTSCLFTPYTYYSQYYLPSLRTGKEPAALIVAATEYIIRKMTGKDKSLKETVPGLSPDSPLFKKLLTNHIIYYSKKPDSLILNQSIIRLKYFVNLLKKKNVNVIFFEMPVNNSLCELTLAKTIRQTIHETFPEGLFLYIDKPACTDYITSDGLHLPDQEAIKYTSYFKRKIANSDCLQVKL